MVLAQKGQQRTKSTLLQHVIPAFRRITGDVPQYPDSLFADVEDGRREELEKYWYDAGGDHDWSAPEGAEGDVC